MLATGPDEVGTGGRCLRAGRHVELAQDRGGVVPDGARGKGECGGDLGVGPAWTTAEALAGAFSAPTGLMPGPERRPIPSSIDVAAGELQQAIGELRDIARGLHPVVLRDAGLAAALRAAANPATCESPKPGRPVLRRGRIHGVHARRPLQRSRTVDRCRPSRSIHAGRGRRNRRPAGIARRDRLPDNHPRRGQSHIRLPERTHPKDLDAPPLATSGQVEAGTRGSR